MKRETCEALVQWQLKEWEEAEKGGYLETQEELMNERLKEGQAFVERFLNGQQQIEEGVGHRPPVARADG